MKVRATLEFDLETEDGKPITDRKEYVYAAEAAHDAIRFRLLGHGFLDDVLIGSHEVDAVIVDDDDQPSASDLMETHGGGWGEHPRHRVQDWRTEAANDETRSGYWDWVAARLEAEQQP